MSDIKFDHASLRAAYAKGLSPNTMIETVLARLAASGDDGIFIHVAAKADLLKEAQALGPFDPTAPP